PEVTFPVTGARNTGLDTPNRGGNAIMTNNGHHYAANAPAPAAPTTAVAVVLDETGSMECWRDAAISGFNEWLASQQKAEGACALTVEQFSERTDAPMCRLLH